MTNISQKVNGRPSAEHDSNERRIYHYRIDSEGRLWHENSEIKDDSVLKFFLRKLEFFSGHRYRVMCMGETNYIDVEDAPYVVQNIEIQQGKVQLKFQGNFQETLDPETLFLGQNQRVYFKVREGQFDATFNRSSFFEFAKHVDQDSQGNFVFTLGSDKFLIL